MSQAVTVQCHMWHLPYLLLKETSVQDNIFTMLIKLITQTLHETCALGGPPLLSISLFKMLQACVILEKQVFRNHVFHLELSFFVYDTDMNIYEQYPPPPFFSWTKLFLVIQCQITFSPTKYQTSVCAHFIKSNKSCFEKKSKLYWTKKELHEVLFTQSN